MATANAQAQASIDVVLAKAGTPAYDKQPSPDAVDVVSWAHVGDPLAEALIGHLRNEKSMGGDQLATIRALRRAGVEVAEAFLADVETPPEWVDLALMRAGAVMAVKNPVAMLMGGFHGALPFTYADADTARVMASTGRMIRGGADFERRFWESAAAFVGALDVDQMRPGGRRWEEWVRIRLLHTSIRMGIVRSKRWDDSTGMPINQLATAAGAHIFGTYRVNVIRHLGGCVQRAEAEGFALMWRWIARLQGANQELLGANETEQFRIAQRIGRQLYRPTDDSREATTSLINGLSAMKTTFPVSRRVHAATIRAMLAEDLVQIFPGRDLPGDLGIARHRRADSTARVLLGLGKAAGRVTRATTRRPDHRRSRLETLVERELGDRRPTFHATPVAGDPGVAPPR